MAKNLQDRLKDEEMRKLAWELAGRTGSELSFIIDGQASEQFYIGPLERSESNYFVKIRDDYLNQNHIVEIPEEILRERGFTEQIRAANNNYNKGVQQREAEIERKRQLKKSKIKKGIIFSAIGLAAFGGGKMEYNYLNNPERLQRIEEERKLDEMAVAITPTKMIGKKRYDLLSESVDYELGSGEKVLLYLVKAEEGTPDRLLIIRNEEEFMSEGWGVDSAKGDALNLQYYWKNVDGSWLSVPVTDEKRNEYRDLIREIYDSKLTKGN